jgi:hypothetical protein
VTSSWFRARKIGRRLSLAVLASVIVSRVSVAVAAPEQTGLGERQAPPSRADSRAGVLVVERDEGAATCPSSAELTSFVESVRGATASASIRYKVQFTRVGAEFRARIEDLSANSVRELADKGGDCGGITRATVITLALLFDAALGTASSEAPQTSEPSHGKPEAAPDGDSKPVPTSGAPSVAREVAPLAAISRDADVTESPHPGGDQSPPWSSGLHLGGTAIVGVAAPSSLGPALGLDIATRDFRGELNAYWGPRQVREFGGGAISTSLLFGSAYACLTPTRISGLRFELCSGAVVGRVSAEARGYVLNGRSHRPWVAVPAVLTLASDAHTLGWQAGIGALFPLQREDFEVAGLGSDYRSWPVAGVLFVRFSVRAHYGLPETPRVSTK